MKEYPSIPRSTGQTFQEIPGAYIFDKPDGSNIRVEGSRKKGWYKFGSRTQLIDHTHTFLGAALSVFARDHNEILSKMLKDERWDSVTVFGEFYGPSSFAGWHDVNEPVEVKHYSIFDISPYKKGILGPKEFRRIDIVGTGNPMLPAAAAGRFLGTASLDGGELMFHVFERQTR